MRTELGGVGIRTALRHADDPTATLPGQGVCVEEQSGATRRSETHTPCPCPGKDYSARNAACAAAKRAIGTRGGEQLT